MSSNRLNCQFVIEAVDSVTLCIANDAIFFVKHPDEMFSILGVAAGGDESKKSLLEIDFDQLRALEGRYSFCLPAPEGAIIRIRPKHWLDDLPYKVHTGRELALMLQGIKPLAVFQVLHLGESEDIIFPEHLYDQYVEEKKFVKHQYVVEERCFPGQPPKAEKHRMVLYALKKESWRINAFILLQHIAKKTGWNDGFERMEGALLGYQDSECDEYFSLMSKAGIKKPWV